MLSVSGCRTASRERPAVQTKSVKKLSHFPLFRISPHLVRREQGCGAFSGYLLSATLK